MATRTIRRMGTSLAPPPKTALRQGLLAAGRPVWHCLRWWHVCSLDAPTVAVAWSAALFHLAGLQARFAPLAILALGTWIVYVLDRILDSAGASPEARSQLAERHSFHRRHRVIFMWLCGAAAAGLGALCLAAPARLIALYLMLAVPVGLYAWSVHGGVFRPNTKAPMGGSRKEAAVAVLFTAAVVAPTLIGANQAGRRAALVAAAMLAPVCWLNCAVIGVAEAPARRSGPVTPAFALAGLAAAFFLWGRAAHALSENVAAALLVSVLLLLALLLDTPPSGSPLRLRIAADLALLTPLLLLLPHA